MSHSHAPLPAAEREAVLKDIAGRLPVKPHPRRRRIWISLMAIGAATFVWLLVSRPERAWGAWAINCLYWMGIAQGAVVLACAIRLANGRWATAHFVQHGERTWITTEKGEIVIARLTPRGFEREVGKRPLQLGADIDQHWTP